MPAQTLDGERSTAHARRSATDDGAAEEGAKIVDVRDNGLRKKKITISLSEKTMRALDEIRRATDADTDSEVFRNAIRLHLTLLRAHFAGVKLYMRSDGSEESVPVTLFADSE
jgi:hypothetical protein